MARPEQTPSQNITNPETIVEYIQNPSRQKKSGEKSTPEDSNPFKDSLPPPIPSRKIKPIFSQPNTKTEKPLPLTTESNPFNDPTYHPDTESSRQEMSDKPKDPPKPPPRNIRVELKPDINSKKAELEAELEMELAKVNTDPTNHFFHHNVGVTYYKLKDDVNALKYLLQARDIYYGDIHSVAPDPKFEENSKTCIKITTGILHKRGKVLADEEKNYEDALKLFLMASEGDPKNPYLRHDIGAMFSALKDYEYAISYFESAQSAITLSPDQEKYADLKKSLKIALNTAHLKSLINPLKKMLTKPSIKPHPDTKPSGQEIPHSPGAAFEDHIYEDPPKSSHNEPDKQENDYKARIETLLTEIIEDPKNPTPYYNIGVNYYNLKDDVNALKYLKKAHYIDPNPKYMYLIKKTAIEFDKKGQELVREKNYEAALELFLMASEGDPKNPYFHNSIGAMHLELGEYQNADVHLYLALCKIVNSEDQEKYKTLKEGIDENLKLARERYKSQKLTQ